MHPLMMELLPWVRQGRCCSQLLMLLALSRRGEDNAALVRAMHGLCHGLGQSGGPCGLLTGGAAVLGLLAGQGGAGDSGGTDRGQAYFTPLVNEYALWFESRVARYGGCDCPDIAQGLACEAGRGAETIVGQPDPLLCGELLAECWEKLEELCAQYAVDMDA